MNKIITSIALVLFLVGTFHLVTAEEVEEPKTSKPAVALTGPISQINEPEYHRVTNDEEWRKLWMRHKGREESKHYSRNAEPLELPIVDFDRYMVVAIFEGHGQSTNVDKRISMIEYDEYVLIRIDRQSYSTLTHSILERFEEVSPYAFYILERTTKSMSIEQGLRSGTTNPSDWKVLITFPEL